MTRFGMGEAVLRSEDRRLLTGEGRFVGDIALPGQAHALFLRSPHAHAALGEIDRTAALAIPGVLAVYTGEDIGAAGLGDIPCVVPVKDRHRQRMPQPGRPLLARERVRFVGEPVAMVVAETPAIGRDALEAIEVDYQHLPAVATIGDALAPEAVQLWPGAPGNIAFFWAMGDAAAVDAAIASAAHTVSLDLINNRVIPCPLEPRAVVGAYDQGEDRYTLYAANQGAHAVRDLLASATLKVPEDRLRVVVGDVGGGFGTKIFHYPEDALALWAARLLGRPVKWEGDRSEAFLADTHGRDQLNGVTAGFDRDGRLLALKVHTYGNMGAYLNSFAPAIPSQMTGCMLAGAYAVPLIHATCEGVYTNTTPVDAYRGAGRPEAAYLIERLMDHAARQLRLAPDEIRRRNFIRPQQMPYATASGCTYDSGDFARNLDDALKASGYADFPGRRAEAKARGRLRGIGLATYVEICGYEAEEATIRFPSTGTVEVLIGTQSTGQGHETAYAQIVAGTLGIPIDAITVVQGDTDRIPFGKGTGGSRSLPVGGPAVVAACETVLERGRAFARQLLQAGQDDIEFAEGVFSSGGGKRSIPILALAEAAREPENLPPGEATPGLDAVARYTSQASTFPNGCHVCEVEIDPETGEVEIAGYRVVDDFGTVVNPLLLAGQIHGGVAQGIGQALFEHAVYDRASGQLLSGSFVDYGLPRAADVPGFEPAFNVVPCATNPLGIKGAGEAGAIAACPAVINAVIDALSAEGVTHIDMPATPATIWRALTLARSGR